MRRTESEALVTQNFTGKEVCSKVFSWRCSSIVVIRISFGGGRENFQLTIWLMVWWLVEEVRPSKGDGL